MSWKCIIEMIFCIYVLLLLRIVGIFSLHFSLDGIKNYNLIPFVGSAIVPTILNFVLFIPYGILLPIVFVTYKWTWKKIICIGAVTSLTIEVLQAFGGRYAELDDLLMNTMGTFIGYFFFVCLRDLRKKSKKTRSSLGVMLTTLIVLFLVIIFMGDNVQQELDGFEAVADNISEIRLYYEGEVQVVPIYSDIYNQFTSQMSNCGGHLLEIKSDLDDEILNNTDCFIEILFQEPQTILFVNVEDFAISNASRVMYNSTKNILYWGNGDYQYYTDYTKLDEQLEEYKEVILREYTELEQLIIYCFE